MNILMSKMWIFDGVTANRKAGGILDLGPVEVDLVIGDRSGTWTRLVSQHDV